jgi:hypothetical protein
MAALYTSEILPARNSKKPASARSQRNKKSRAAGAAYLTP